MMLVKKIIKSTVFCGIGILVGKTVSEQKHKNTVKKILSADYMDDHTKIKLLQDLNKRLPSTQIATDKLKKNIKMITTQSASLVKKLNKNSH